MTETDKFIMVSHLRLFLERIQKEVDRLTKRNNQEYVVEMGKPKGERSRYYYKVMMTAKIRKKKGVVEDGE